MPIDPFTWIIIGSFLAGAAVGYFWDELKEWAIEVIGNILDGINRAIEIASKAVVYLIKKGRNFYKKRVEVYVKNTKTGGTKVKYGEEEIDKKKIPENILDELKEGEKLKLLQG